MISHVQAARESRTFVCENGDCLAQVTLSATEEQYKSRLYFSPTIDCPICSRKMYEVRSNIDPIQKLDPVSTVGMYEEVEEAAKCCHNCERCIPLGKRKGRAAIYDGRFDTKEKCCETRRRVTGCPIAVQIKQRREREAIIATSKKDEREKVLKFIRTFIAENPLDGSCPFNKMNSEECLDKRDGQCEICVIDHAIESLNRCEGSK
ncbi:MAG: hypothetical protein PHX61_02485 [Alphaproteobacteria bacterium]|nr:hypothetical protein [Alphaproteobacteria bacterium]